LFIITRLRRLRSLKVLQEIKLYAKYKIKIQKAKKKKMEIILSTASQRITIF